LNVIEINTFWSRQFSQIKEEGWAAVRRKARKTPFHLTGFIVALPVVLIVRLIRPFKLVRFGYFYASRIGQFGFDVEYYLTEKKLGMFKKKSIDLLYLQYKPVNDFKVC